MYTCPSLRLLLIAALLGALSGCLHRAPTATATIVNVIPNGLSGETNQDSEPNVAVNPSNPQQIAASAFTPNPTGAGNAPIFVSTDGGFTWALNPIVQSNVMTGDISLRFTRTTNNLYAGILRRPGGLRMSIQSTGNFAGAALMNVQVDRMPNLAGRGPDQPYVQATDVGGRDRVYVGNNDLLVMPQTASVEQTVDSVATWTTQRVETRVTQGQNLPPVRPAVGTDNVIYAAYIARRMGGDEVVVVRDDNGAIGANPYRSLVGVDGNSGARVVTGINVPFENFAHANFGQEPSIPCLRLSHRLDDWQSVTARKGGRF